MTESYEPANIEVVKPDVTLFFDYSHYEKQKAIAVIEAQAQIAKHHHRIVKKLRRLRRG